MKKNLKYVFIVFLYLALVYSISIVEKYSPNANIKSFVDALWYSLVTLTTVGYGDFYPVSTVGKILSLFVILGSLGLLGYSIGIISNLIHSYMEKNKTGFYGTKLKNHFVIIGWNEFARKVATQIYNAGHKVVFVTNSRNELELIKNMFAKENPFVLFIDYNNLDDYTKVNISKSKAVFVNFDEDTDSMVFVLNIKSKYDKLNIVLNCKNTELKDTLRKAGVSHVISRNEIASSMLASYLFEPHVAEYTEDLISTSVEDDDQDIQQFIINNTNPYLGMEFFDVFVELKKDHNAILIALVIDGILDKDPADDYVLKEGDYMVLISKGESKSALVKIFSVNEGV